MLALADGTKASSQLRSALHSALGDQAIVVFDALFGRLAPLLTHGDIRVIDIQLEQLEQIKPPDPAEGLRALPGPRVLHWCVTRYCPRRCAYCYASPRHGSKAPDSTIGFEALRGVFREAAELGAKCLVLTGGEPLLRADLPEILAEAIACRIEPLLATKYPIDLRFARRLADAGLRHIALSLDTLDPALSRSWIGCETYPQQVKRSARNLSMAGIAFSVQAVASQLNEDHLGCVAAFATQVGAQTFLLMPIDPASPAPAGADANSALRLDRHRLNDLAQRLASRFPALRVAVSDSSEEDRPGACHCDIGFTRLFFLPDGLVHRCYRLTSDKTLCGQNLSESCLADAWHDPQFAHVVSPPRSAYRETPCYECAEFARCHATGRCLDRAKRWHGRYTERDRSFCICRNPAPLQKSGRVA